MLNSNAPRPDPLFVDRAEQLESLVNRLRTSPWLALDTEFLREKTYRPRLCLLQLATPELVACVDPLALDDLAPLLDLLYDPEITKVLHAATQDLEIFYWMRGSVPQNLFDTQIAASLLGHAEQIGYGNLVREVLGVELGKAHTRADWTHRPLGAGQLQYAADDVIYLAQLYPTMHARLAELGRLEWLQPDFEALTRPELYERPVEEAWQRIRGAEALREEARAILQELAGWRELTARRRDLPRGWLLKDSVLLELARRPPVDRKALRATAGLSDRMAQRHGADLLAIIERARECPAPPPLPPRRKPQLTPEQETRIGELLAVVGRRAEASGLNPELLAPRKTIEALVRGEPDSPLLRGWRGHLLGQELRAALATAQETSGRSASRGPRR